MGNSGTYVLIAAWLAAPLGCGQKANLVQDQRLLAPSLKPCSGDACQRSASDLESGQSFRAGKSPSADTELFLEWQGTSGSLFTIEAARQEGCSQPTESKTTQALSTSFRDLEEGTWFFCLKPAVRPGVIQGPLLGQVQVLIDRTAPRIFPPESETMEGASILELKIEDQISFSCSWSSTAKDFKVQALDTQRVQLLNIFAGTYPVHIACTDLAGNQSELDFTVNLKEPKTPVDVGELSVAAGPDLSWTRPGTLAGLASGAKSVSWSQISGPGELLFANKESLQTLVTPSLAGVYTVQLTATSPQGKMLRDELVLTYKPTPLSLKANLVRSSFLLFTTIQAMRTSGNYGYVAREKYGLSVIDMSHPTSLNVVANHTLGNGDAGGWAAHLAIAGQTLYVANWDRGLTAVDISQPSSPLVLGSLPLSHAAAVIIEGTTAYVALQDGAGSGGLALVNISNPRQMSLIKTLDTGGLAASLDKSGPALYLTHRQGGSFQGLKVIDVSNPLLPKVVKSYARTSLEEIKVVGGNAFVAAGPQGLEVFDLSNPLAPVSRGLTALTGSTSSYASSLDIAESFLVLADSLGARMLVFDMKDITHPKQQASFLTSQNKAALWVHASGRRVFVSSEKRGLEGVDVFD